MARVDVVNNTCTCEWCSIRRDLGSAEGDARGWHWARLWRHYLDTVLLSYAALEKGDHLCRINIDEAGELARESYPMFSEELDAALNSVRPGPPPE